MILVTPGLEHGWDVILGKMDPIGEFVRAAPVGYYAVVSRGSRSSRG